MEKYKRPERGFLFIRKEVRIMADELTQKQKMFADEFVLTGNATQSYIKVYNCSVKNAESSSSDLLRNPKVTKYIAEMNQEIKNDKIADMQEIKEFWTNTVRNDEVEMKDRIKASELIGKTNGAFIEKLEHSGKIELPQIIISK